MARPTKTELEQAHTRYKEADYLCREARDEVEQCRQTWLAAQTSSNMTAWVDAAERNEEFIEQREEAWKHLYNVLEDAGI